MVFSLGDEVEASEDIAPLSPEQIATAHAKNNALNESLGLEQDVDPTSGEETDDEVEATTFSTLKLENIALKNALVDSDIQPSSTNSPEPGPLPVYFVLPSDPHTATANNASSESGNPESEDEEQEVYMVVPAKVAAFLRKGGCKIVIEPVDDVPVSESEYLASAEVPPADTDQQTNKAQPNQHNNSETETEEGECSESENESSKAKKGGFPCWETTRWL